MDDQKFKDQLSRMQEKLDAASEIKIIVPDLTPPPIKINTDVIARLNQQMDEVRDYQQSKDQAVFDTAKHLKSINGKVQSIDDGLSKERAEREKADEANKRYTQMWNKINLAIGIIGVILAAFALFKP